MRPIDIVCKVAPNAKGTYLKAFEDGDPLFAAAGITTPLRLAHFLAQTAEETGGYVIFVESGNYSAQRMCEVWPNRFPSLAAAAPYAHDEQALFDNVYANRMGNGPPATGDGFRYRGRGILQTTGREAYRKYGKRCGVDFEANPELIYAPEHALKPALAEWTDSGCNALADANDIEAITRRINGGLTGFAERQRWFRAIRPLIDRVELNTGAGTPATSPGKPPVPPAVKPLPDHPPAPVKPAPAGWFAALLAALIAYFRK